MNYKKEQKELKEKSRKGLIFRPKDSHNKLKDGLIGHEQVALASLFDKEGKNPRKYKKLSGIQKKVIRKMKWNKQIFLTYESEKPTKK